MSLRKSPADVLKEALRSRHDEPFEKSLGRAVRHLEGRYEDYLVIIAKVREYGRSNKMSLRGAAKILSNQP